MFDILKRSEDPSKSPFFGVPEQQFLFFLDGVSSPMFALVKPDGSWKELDVTTPVNFS